MGSLMVGVCAAAVVLPAVNGILSRGTKEAFPWFLLAGTWLMMLVHYL